MTLTAKGIYFSVWFYINQINSNQIKSTALFMCQATIWLSLTIGSLPIWKNEALFLTLNSFEQDHPFSSL